MLALIAATEFETRLLRKQLIETEPLPGGYARFCGTLQQREVVLVHCGIGKANAAAATAALLSSCRPDALINIGCGGAYVDRELDIGDLVLACGETFADEGSDSPDGFLDMEQLGLPLCQQDDENLYNRLPVDSRLLDAARGPLGNFADRSGIQLGSGPFVTVSTCTGTDRQGARRAVATGGICENMEGAAIAMLAIRFQVPFLEFRGISNLASERNREGWDLPAACRTVQNALLDLLQQWPGTEP